MIYTIAAVVRAEVMVGGGPALPSLHARHSLPPRTTVHSAATAVRFR